MAKGNTRSSAASWTRLAASPSVRNNTNIDEYMKKLLFVLMTLCAVMNVQAQTIQVGQKFWDGYELYIVQEIRLGTIVYMTTKHGAELTLEKIAGKQGEYKLIPSRQADECPFGAEYGWKVKHIMQEGENFLAIRKPNGDVVWTMKLTKLNEQECEEMQQMMEQEEPCLLAFILHLCLELFDSYFCQFT